LPPRPFRTRLLVPSQSLEPAPLPPLAVPRYCRQARIPRQAPSPPASLQAFRSLPHLRGKPLAAAEASPSFALAPALLASLLAPPNTATPPRSAPLPARISQSIVPGRHRADRLLRPLAISR